MLKEDYRNAMNKIKADDEFKAQLLERLEAQQQKQTNTVHTAMSVRVPLIASLASIAVIALVIYSSASFILPLLRNSKNSVSDKYSGQENLTAGSEETIEKSAGTKYTEDLPDNAGASETVTNSGFTLSGSTASTVTDDITVPGTAEDYAGTSTLNEVDVYEEYRIICYSGIGDEPKAELLSEKTVEYHSVLHFSFEGFDKYGAGLKKNDIVFTASLSENYMLSDFFTDYYNIIAGRNGSIRIDNGIIDSFFDIPSSSAREIRVFVDGIEMLNLDNVRLSDICTESDVYFTVSVT